MPCSPDAAQRVALAERCAAEPGPYKARCLGRSRFCEAALREELRAASRPGHEGYQQKQGPKAPFKSRKNACGLLDLGFLELDVLARDGVVLLLDQLVGHGARVLLGDVIEAVIRGGDELDLDGDRFGHVENLYVWKKEPARQTGQH